MKIKHIAKTLRDTGFPVLKVTEGNEDQDGSVPAPWS